MAFVASKHDLGLVRQDGSTVVGLMVTRGPKGEPGWVEQDDEYLAAQQIQTPGYAGLPYEKELRLAQDDWRSGFGLERFDKNDPLRYLSATNMDMRHRGMGILSNTPTVQSLAGPSGILDSGMEAWANASTLTNWTKVTLGGAGGTLDREAGTVNDGTFSAKLTTGGVGGDKVGIRQSMTNFSNDYRGLVANFGWYAKTGQASHARVTIFDGTDTTSSSFHTGGGGWELLTVSHTINGAANQLRVTLTAEVSGTNIAYWDGLAQAPTEGPVQFYRHGLFNGDEYFSRGSFVFKINDSDGVVSSIAILGAIVTSIAQFDDGSNDRLYIAQGASENYWRMSTAEALTQTDSKAFFFAAVGTVLWKGLKPRSVYSALNPIADGNWSGVTTVDAASLNMTDIVSFDNTIYIMKEDRPFFLDSDGNVVTLTNTTVPLTASTSGANPTEFGSFLYMPWGSQGLLEYESAAGVLTFRDPSQFATRLQAFAGRVFAVTRDEAYIYAIIDNSDKIEVVAGRLETIDSGTPFVFHPLHQITLTGCQTAIVSSVFQKRMWISSTNSGQAVYYIPLPSGYGYIEGDANRKFQTGGFVETSWLHGEFQGDTKAMIKIRLDMGHTFDTGIYFKVYYKLFEESSYTQVGTDASFKGDATDRRPEAFIKVAAKPSSSMIRFKIEGVTNDTGKSPILLGFDARAILFPAKRTVIRADIRVADNIVDKQGQQYGEGQADIIAALDEARGGGASVPSWPITINDAVGTKDTSTARTFRVLPGTTKTFIRNDKLKKSEFVYTLLLQEVDLT